MDIVRFYGTTDHGGMVIDAIPHTKLNGKQIAGKGNLVLSPLRQWPSPAANLEPEWPVAGTDTGPPG